MGTDDRLNDGPVDRGSSGGPWTDPGGVEWHIEVGWTEATPGVIVPSRVVLDSHGKRGVTSSTLRAFEPKLRDLREQRARDVQAMAERLDAGEVADRARAQVDAYVAGLAEDEQAAEGKGRRGRPVDHGVWLERVLVLWTAKVEGRSQLKALMAAEGIPGEREDTARVYVRRARAWDRETGLNLLTGPADTPRNRVRANTTGRPTGGTTKTSRKATTKGRKP